MSALIGARPLLKAAMRQDARNIAPWVILISVLSATSILAYRWVFPETSDRVALSGALSANPAMALIFGPVRDLMTNDGFNAWRAGALGAFFAGLMAILLVVRNSRADEDSGQAELIASGVITRRARLAVPMAMAAIASVLLFVVCFLLTWASGGEVVPTLLLSATFSASALMFAGVAAVSAQLGSDARSASTIAIGTLGALYVVRGYLDASGADEWTQWLTPFGWLSQTKPATENNAWPLLAALGLAAALLALAVVLQEHRDFGLGVIPQRPGRPAAPRMSVGGLVLRMHRLTLLMWLGAFALLGTLYGELASSVQDIVANNPGMAEFIRSGAVEVENLSFAFVATIMHIVGIIAAIVGAQVIMRVRSEELEHRVEPLLAGSLSRWRYLGANVAVALTATALAMIVAGTALGIVASRADVGIGFVDVLGQAVATIPAVWLLVGVSMAAVGARPVARMAGWGAIVATFGITLLGPTFKFPEWAMSISPLHHVPNVVAEDPSWISLVGLAGVVLLLHAVGFVGFRHRDVGAA